MDVHTHTYIHAFTHAHVRSYLRTLTHKHISTLTHVDIHACTHNTPLSLSHTHTHTHTLTLCLSTVAPLARTMCLSTLRGPPNMPPPDTVFCTKAPACVFVCVDVCIYMPKHAHTLTRSFAHKHTHIPLLLIPVVRTVGPLNMPLCCTDTCCACILLLLW
jgi:hypothetical protein